jgi:nitrite reductase (NADH) small subunit
MGRHVVGTLADLPPGSRRIVPLGGPAGIGVYNVGGAFYALRNICPHEGAPLCLGPQRGRVRAELDGDRYRIVSEREGEVVVCPWHEWEFDLTTGRALHDPRQRVKTYPVEVDGDEVAIQLDG